MFLAGQYVPFTNQDSYYSENGDNYNTANSNNNNNNGNSDYNYNDYDNDNTLPDLLFPDSTKSPPTGNGITWMPFPPASGDEDGEIEVRYDNKVSISTEKPSEIKENTLIYLNYFKSLCRCFAFRRIK